MRRPDPVTANGAAGDHADVPPELLERWPHLCELMVSGHFDDGEPKGSGSLYIEPMTGRWCGRLKIRGSGLMLTLWAADPLALLVAIEAALASGDAPWQPDPYADKKDPKKKR